MVKTDSWRIQSDTCFKSKAEENHGFIIRDFVVLIFSNRVHVSLSSLVQRWRHLRSQNQG